MRKSFRTTLDRQSSREAIYALLAGTTSLELDDLHCSSRWIWVAQLHDFCCELATLDPENTRIEVRDVSTSMGQAWRRAAARRDITPVRTSLNSVTSEHSPSVCAALAPICTETYAVCEEIERFGTGTDLQILVALLFDLIVDTAPDPNIAETMISRSIDTLESLRIQNGPTPTSESETHRHRGTELRRSISLLNHNHPVVIHGAPRLD